MGGAGNGPGLCIIQMLQVYETAYRLYVVTYKIYQMLPNAMLKCSNAIKCKSFFVASRLIAEVNNFFKNTVNTG